VWKKKRRKYAVRVVSQSAGIVVVSARSRKHAMEKAEHIAYMGNADLLEETVFSTECKVVRE